MSVDTPPPSERPEGVPFKVSPELQKVIGEMNEDERLAFAQTHGFEFKRQTNFGTPDKYVVVRRRTDREFLKQLSQIPDSRYASDEDWEKLEPFEPQFELRVRDLTIDPELKTLIQLNDEKTKAYNDRVHDLQRIISDRLEDERAKWLTSRKGSLIKKFEGYLLDLRPDFHTRKAVRVLGDGVGNLIYDSHVSGKPHDKGLLQVFQKDFELALELATDEADKIEKDLIKLGIIIAKPQVKSTHPYR